MSCSWWVAGFSAAFFGLGIGIGFGIGAVLMIWVHAPLRQSDHP